MSIQKENDILKAHTVVLVFWFFVLFVLTGSVSLAVLAKNISLAVAVLVMGLTVGVAAWLFVHLFLLTGLREKLGEHWLRGAKCSMGDIPTPLAPKSKTEKANADLNATPWWQGYEKSYPQYAAALKAVMAVMAANPKTPASPVQGGHGGATLIQHSLNVVKTIRVMAHGWRYEGHRNREGKISFGLIDGTKKNHRFNPADPILPLAAFCHDVGKVLCFNGKVTDTFRVNRHDVEGVRLLRAIPAIMELPFSDRTALLIAVEFHHHIGELPRPAWLNDRMRSLLELLIAADIATGKNEGRNGGVVRDENDDEGVVYAPPPPPLSQSTDTARSEMSDRLPIMVLAKSVLLAPGAINGGNVSTRIAWKYGGWLYINDYRLREAVAAHTQDSGYAALPHRGNMHPFTLELMSSLAKQGHLMMEHDGRVFSPKRAIFNTVSTVKNKEPVENKFIIVASVAAFPGAENVDDCKSQPVVVGCSWGDRAGTVATADAPLPQDEINDGDESSEVMPPSDTDVIDAVDVVDTSDVAEKLRQSALTMTTPFLQREIGGVPCFLFESDLATHSTGVSSFEGLHDVSVLTGGSGKVYVVIPVIPGAEKDGVGAEV